MEDSVTDKGVNSDFLSQSYSEGIGRVTGTKGNIVNFQIPKEVLDNRIKTWNNLFDKYSEEMSDDIELNVKTLEPEEKETEEFSEEEYSCRRVPMRKPATLVQYWINTGNTPYKVFLDKNEFSESGSSLSEEEITSPSYSLLSNKANESSKHKHENNTSFSSVDTAAYILSNANVTKKADTIAIIEGAKSNVIKSSEDNCIKDVGIINNDTTACIETSHVLHNRSSNNIPHNDISHFILMENVPDTNNQLVPSTVISANTAQSNVSSKNLLCDAIDKPDVLSASEKNVNLHNIDHIVTIFQQFNEASKRLSIDDKSNDSLSESKALKEHSFNEKQQEPMSLSTAKKTVREDGSLTPFHRKKLYTGRNSPVDLILIEKNNSDFNLNKPKSPDIKLSLHPALDPDNSVRSKSLVHKDKSKRNLPSKKTLGSKKMQAKSGQKHSSVSNKNISDIAVVTNNNNTDSIVDNSVQNLLDSPNEIDKRNSDNLVRDCNDINLSMTNITQKNPVVCLERITSFKEKNLNFITNKGITQRNNAHNDSVALKHLHVYQIENLESADSDHSTILICKCNNTASQDSSSVGSSFHLRLSTENECSVMNAEKKNDKPTNLKNVDMKQNKKVFVTLERLSQSVIERYTKATQALNIKGDLPISSKKLPNKSKIYSSNSHGTNIKNDVELREIKVILERLPADIYPKKSNNATSINFPTVKDKISQNTSMNNNKRKSKDTIKSPNDENKKTARTIHKINNNYSLRIRTRSKIDDNEMSSTSDDVHYDNQIFNGTESNFTSRYRNHDSKVHQDQRRKCSVLDFTSSDESDLVRLIQPSKKRLKTLTDTTSKTHIAGQDLYDEITSGSTNKDRCDSNKNIDTTVYSSKQSNLRKIGGSIREKNRGHEAKVKSSDSNVTSTDSSLMYKHKKFSLFTRRNGRCDGTMKNLNGRRKIHLFSNTENISDSSERYQNKTTKENKINHKNDTCVTLFQTKTFTIESSDSDQSNCGNTSTRKSFKITPTYDKVQQIRFNGRADKKKLSNGFHAKTHANKHSHLLNSFTRKYNAANKTHNTRKRSRSIIGTVVETNERFDKEFNNNINLLGTTTKTMLYRPVASNTRHSLMQKDNTILNTSLPNNTSNKLLRSRQISEKLNLKNSQVNEQHHVKSKVNKSLMFQTKSYYDSDSSGC